MEKVCILCSSTITRAMCRQGASHIRHVLPVTYFGPEYLPSDNIKDQWSDSDGIVQTFDKEWKTLVYAERATYNQVSAMIL